MAIADTLTRLFRHEAAGGVVLMLAAAAAMIVANSPLAGAYEALLAQPFGFVLGEARLVKPLLLWINDGLMPVFFFLVGLELKREFLEGKLRNRRDAALPGMAALGGMALPALIYLLVTRAHPELHQGWAIPAATDIAFAIGVLALVGRGVPASLKLFLLTLAILDDLGAIVIIALFYSEELHAAYLLLAALPLAVLALMNRAGVHRIAPYVLFGAVLWFLILKSGVHATVAGVLVALFIPLADRFGSSPLHALEHALPPYVYFLILPVFAFANAGVVLAGMRPADLIAPLPLGIALGLFLGKQIGVLGTTWAMVRLGLARLPHGASWTQVYGVACIAGIGFTMSLFIGSLGFEDPAMMNGVRIGVLSGSAAAALLGYLVLRLARAAPADAPAEAAARPARA
ncbi:MAG: Na+/H+ antiporter NhaA [Rhodobacteraceae bacterium]|nr:Na+/H+ antiporter NhaA [Paracoccaceae bacterium]